MSWISIFCFTFSVFICLITIVVNGERRTDLFLPPNLNQQKGGVEDVCICTAIYDPICGIDKKTYGNSCEMNCARKKNPGVFGVCKGECPCCKEPYFNNPVGIYGEKGGFWGPSRAIAVQTGTAFRDFATPEDEKSVEQRIEDDTIDCTERFPTPGCPCILISKPVCGNDGNTYGNSCELVCQQKVKPCLRQACEGECPCCPCSRAKNGTTPTNRKQSSPAVKTKLTKV